LHISEWREIISFRWPTFKKSSKSNGHPAERRLSLKRMT